MDGKGIVFPRYEWPAVKQKYNLETPGVYILVGDSEEDELRTLYVGQGEAVYTRINMHIKEKNFWDWGIIFISTSNNINTAHIRWLEYALVKKAFEINRCKLDNGNTPQ